MADTLNITSNVIDGSTINSNLSTGVTINTTVNESTNVSANVVSGGKGEDGVGVPLGGTTGQVLAKIDATNYNTQWVNQSDGGGSVTSVNAQTGIVLLDTDDIDDTAINRYTNDTDITRLATTSGTNTGDQDLSGYVPTTRTVNTKPLSSNITLNQDEVLDGTTYKQYSQTEKTKLAGIAPGATANTGTVTSVSVTTANGVSGSVATSTTTPAISLSLGAIAPSSVNSVVLSGSSTPTLAVTGTSSIAGSHTGTSSGTNTGDQTSVTGNAGTATTLQTARTIGTLTGDVTSAGSTFNGSANNTNATTLATVNSNVGSFGSTTQVATFTVNAKGLTTAAANTSIQIAESQVTNLVSDLAGKQGTITLTTVGTSGAATLVSNTLNIPNYAGGGGGGGGDVTGPASSVDNAIARFDATSGKIIQDSSVTISDGINPTITSTGSSLRLNGGSGVIVAQSQLDLSSNQISNVANPSIAQDAATKNYVDINKGITRSIVSITGNTTAGSTALVDYVYFVSAGATLTLPTAVGNSNSYNVTNTGATNITVNTTSSQTINGNTSMIISPNSSREFISNNTNWGVF